MINSIRGVDVPQYVSFLHPYINTMTKKKMKKTTTDLLPAVYSIDKNSKWYLETPERTYQGDIAEELFVLLCDLLLDAMQELPENKRLISQITEV